MSQPATAVAPTIRPAPALANQAGMERHGLSPLAEIVTSAVVGVDPCIMGIGRWRPPDRPSPRPD